MGGTAAQSIQKLRETPILALRRIFNDNISNGLSYSLGIFAAMPALNRTWGATLVLLATLASVSNAFAGHPHWGGMRGHHHAWHHHGYGGYGYGWGGYGGLGYTSSISIGFGGLGYSSWYARPYGYSSFYANYYAPSVAYYVPSTTYYVPSVSYYVPSAPYCAPSCVPSVITYDPNCCVPNFCDDCVSAVEAPIDNGPTVAPTSPTTYSAPSGAAAPAAVPASLLAAADAIFQAGGYRQAATAYAQLHVKYGSSEQIFERRFVAQVACGDYDQAAVVLASAQGAGFPIERLTAKDSNQNHLLAGHPELVNGWTERLAQHALQVGEERESLEMMATWLNVTGQPQRAGLFLAMAERLSLEAANPTNLANSTIKMEELPLPSRSKSALVSLQQ